MKRGLKSLGIEHEELKDMHAPAWRILCEMEQGHRRITNGHYRLIVGDDASGRLFGKIFAGVIGDIHELCGHPRPPLVFCVGHPKQGQRVIDWMTEIISDRLDHVLKTNEYSELGRKLPRPLRSDIDTPQILITTDGVQSGSSLAPAVTACNRHGVGMEVATILKFDGYRDRKKYLGDTMIYDGLGDRSIYQKYSLIGVSKKLGVDPIASAYRADGSAATIASARRDVDIIQHDLVEQFAKKFLSRKKK